MSLKNLQAISVNIVDIDSTVIEPLVVHLNTFRDNVSHLVESFRLIPAAHEAQLLKVLHRFVVVVAPSHIFCFIEKLESFDTFGTGMLSERKFHTRT